MMVGRFSGSYLGFLTLSEISEHVRSGDIRVQQTHRHIQETFLSPTEHLWDAEKWEIVIVDAANNCVTMSRQHGLKSLMNVSSSVLSLT